MPWVRQKLDGKAPPEVCCWLLRVVARYDLPMVVLAAEEALLELLEEDNKASSSEWAESGAPLWGRRSSCLA